MARSGECVVGEGVQGLRRSAEGLVCRRNRRLGVRGSVRRGTVRRVHELVSRGLICLGNRVVELLFELVTDLRELVFSVVVVLDPDQHGSVFDVRAHHQHRQLCDGRVACQGGLSLPEVFVG